MACEGFGDGIASLIGSSYPFGPYSTFPFGPTDRKTVSGSIACFLGSMFGIVFLQSVALPDGLSRNGEPLLSFVNTALPLSVLATIVEAVSGSFDNIFIAGALYTTLKYTKTS